MAKRKIKISETQKLILVTLVAGMALMYFGYPMFNAWVCPTCYLQNVALDTTVEFNIDMQNGNTPIENPVVNYYIYGPHADTTFYTKPKVSGSVPGVPPFIGANDQVALVLPMTFSSAEWNAGDGYQLLIEVLDGSAPVSLDKTLYDVSYYNDPICRAHVDSLAQLINGQMMTCAVDVATESACLQLGGAWNLGTCCKPVADTYASYCGGVAWEFNVRSYGGSITVSIGSVSVSL